MLNILFFLSKNAQILQYCDIILSLRPYHIILSAIREWLSAMELSFFSECEILSDKPTQTKTDLSGCSFNEYEVLGCRIGVCLLSN